MKKIYIIGDMHTVSAFRLSGVVGVISDRESAPSRLEEIIGNVDAGIVGITSACAEGLQSRITDINLNLPDTVVIEIPGIDDSKGLTRSLVGYVAEALGISL